MSSKSLKLWEGKFNFKQRDLIVGNNEEGWWEDEGDVEFLF